MGPTLRRRAIAFLASILPIVLLLSGLELAIRVHAGEWHWVNYLQQDLDLRRGTSPASFDPALGWVPRAGFRGASTGWLKPVSIDPLGLRESGPPAPAGPPPALVLGDSFTFGVDVGDTDTWPAQLKALVGRPVLNAGVFGYGLDQMVLRLEKMLPFFKPAPRLLIISFIEDDVRRAEDKRRFGADKPYLAVVGGALQLQTGHIRHPASGEPDIGWIRQILGYSSFCDWFMRKVSPGLWLLGLDANLKVHHDGEAVAGLLFQRVAALAKARKMEVLVLAQYWRKTKPEEAAVSARVLQAARAAGLETLDLRPLLEVERARDAAAYKALFQGHMTESGNAWVAARVFETLKANPRLAAAWGLP